MSYQAYLQKAGGLIPYQGRESGPFARLAALILLLLLALPAAAQECRPLIQSISVAQELEDNGRPPDSGWVQVTLPDYWSERWPGFSGSVWYRIRWQDDCFEHVPVAVTVNHIVMAGKVYVNDDLLWRDKRLDEPRSRSWNMPRYWLLPPSLLDPWENTLWVRVTGMAHEMPGLGDVSIGDPAEIEPLHQEHYWYQRQLFVANLTVSLVLGCLFLAVWVMRRSEVAFGWYALACLAWVVFISNLLVTSPWPFSGSESWSRMNMTAFVIYCMAFCMFTWRFGKQHLPRLERFLWALTLLVCVAIWMVPLAELGTFLLFTMLGGVLIFLLNCIQFQFHAWRHRNVQNTLLAVCLLVFLGIAMHDMLLFMKVIESGRPFTPISTLVSMICMFLILAWSFAGNMRRIEMFNEQLQVVVEQTRAQLTDTLQREHQLEISNIRLNERLQISHDLHDSLGSSLMRSIVMVEQSGPRLGSGQFLPMLKELRDDLRQIIDSSSEASTSQVKSPSEWLAPLRRRFVFLFEELDLQSSWILPDVWPCQLSSAQLLALTRFVEEALTNVLKHAQASRLQIEMQALSIGGLSLSVKDNGIGFDPDTVIAAGAGVGMRSMHARIERIGGRLEVNSSGGTTQLKVILVRQNEGAPGPVERRGNT